MAKKRREKKKNIWWNENEIEIRSNKKKEIDKNSRFLLCTKHFVGFHISIYIRYVWAKPLLRVHIRQITKNSHTYTHTKCLLANTLRNIKRQKEREREKVNEKKTIEKVHKEDERHIMFVCCIWLRTFVRGWTCCVCEGAFMSIWLPNKISKFE